MKDLVIKRPSAKTNPVSQDSSNKTVEPRHNLEAGLENKPHHDAEVHFDRGWAWVVCATTFLMEFFVGGLITSSGVIYAALVDEFKKSRAETGESTFKSSGLVSCLNTG